MIPPEYLTADFDPSTLTIAKLKSLISEVGIALPMKQEKKTFYVHLFRQHITGNASKLLKAQVKPSAEGILAVSKNGSPKIEETAQLQGRKFANSLRKPDSSPEQENPFQTGSSDEDIAKTFAKVRRRTTSPSKLKEDMKALVTPTKFMKLPDFPIAGYVDANEVLRQNHLKKSSVRLKHAGISLLSMLFVTVALGWIFSAYEYNSRPYCSENLPGSCRSCPNHAKCFDQKLSCNDGYLLQHSWLFGAPSCVSDREKLRNIEKMVSQTESFVSKHVGQVECGQKQGELYVSAREIKKTLKEINPDWDSKRFENYWNDYQQELLNGAAKELKVFAKQGEIELVSSINPVYPIMCRVQKATYLFFVAYIKHIFLAIIGFISCVFGLWKWKAKLNRKKIVLDLTEGVASVLIKQEERFRHGEESRSALSVDQLRDFFLHNIRSISDRNSIWKDVRKEIYKNSSVRETVILLEGEQHDAWQWIGSSSLLSPRK